MNALLKKKNLALSTKRAQKKDIPVKMNIFWFLNTITYRIKERKTSGLVSKAGIGKVQEGATYCVRK